MLLVTLQHIFVPVQGALPAGAATTTTHHVAVESSAIKKLRHFASQTLCSGIPNYSMLSRGIVVGVV